MNEPFHAADSLLVKQSLGGNGATGWDWVVEAFRLARDRFPDSKLLINEYGIINDPSLAKKYVDLITTVNSAGYRLNPPKILIDGIGIQGHCFNIDTVQTSTMKEVLDILAATGLPIYVSEFDANGGDESKGDLGNEDKQLKVYQEKFPILWEHPRVLGITLWGFVTGTTWKYGTGIYNYDGDNGGSERKALKWLKEYLDPVKNLVEIIPEGPSSPSEVPLEDSPAPPSQEPAAVPVYAGAKEAENTHGSAILAIAVVSLIVIVLGISAIIVIQLLKKPQDGSQLGKALNE